MTQKLSDIQLVLLATASQRADGSLLPPPASLGDQAVRVRKAVTALIKRGLASEYDVTDSAQAWREERERRLGVAITDAGRGVIAAAEADKPDGSAAMPNADGAAMAEPATTKAGAAPTIIRPTKIGLVTDLLRREQGATLTELVEATGRLPHTTRAALTGLRKKGEPIARTKRGDMTCYSIAAVA